MPNPSARSNNSIPQQVPIPSYTPESTPEGPRPYQTPSEPRVFRSVSTSECTPKQDIGRIHFDCQISDENYETLRRDLEYLRGMELRGPGARVLQRQLQLPELSGEILFHWLEEKVQFLLDETFEVLAPHSSASNKSSVILSAYRNPFAVCDASLEIP